MKGDFTRSTFRVQNHYSSVRMQQGRLQLDADWNEQVDIQRHLLQMQARDMIGRNGVSLADPSTALSFQIGVTDDGQDLTIAPGRIYVDGVLCELEASSQLSFGLKPSPPENSDQGQDAQPENTSQANDHPIEIEVPTLWLDGQELAAGQWVELFAIPSNNPPSNNPPSNNPEVSLIPLLRTKIDIVDKTPRENGFTITFTSSIQDLSNLKEGKLRRILTWKTQPDYPPSDVLPQEKPSGSPVTYLAYLDVWQRHLTAIEDPGLREPALNIPDTATRTKTVWQVKLLPLPPDSPNEGQQQLSNLQNRHAHLKARVSPGLRQGGTSSARRLENQLYRVEIHTGGKTGTATFKWSRDNGAIVSAIADLEDTGANVITLTPTGRDVSQLFAPNQWVEITDDVRELHEIPGTLVRLTAATSGTKLVFQKAKDSDQVNRDHFPKKYRPKVRRWDHATSTAEILTVKDRWIPLGDEGIEVWFEENSQYKPGDYWLIPARTITNNIEWTRDTAGEPLPQEINGPFHAYCSLAVLTCDQNGDKSIFELKKDDRRQFAGLAETLPLQGGTITGELTVEKQLEAKQDLIVGKTLKVHSGQISSSNSDLFLRTGENNRLAIAHTTGNVSIGISPLHDSNRKLHVHGSADQTQTLRLSQGDRYVDIGTSDSSGTAPVPLVQLQTNCNGYQFDEDIRVATGGIGSTNTQNLFLRTGSTTRLTVLQSNGNVGIGHSLPSAKLQIEADPAGAPPLRLSQSNQYVDLGFRSDQFISFQTSGVGYSFDKPLRVSQDNLSVNLGLRSDKFVGFQTNGLGYKFDKPIVHNGSPQVSSSRVFKENIIDFDIQEAAALLKSLRPVKFTHRADKNKQIQAGFLAEEVPSLVASRNRQAIRLMEIIAILTQNVKQHEQTITALTQKITQQQAMIDSLLGDVLDMWISRLG